MALTIAVAIAWPSNIPLGMLDIFAPRVAIAETANNRVETGRAKADLFQSLKVGLAWQGSDRPLHDDQLEESDEGDDRDDLRQPLSLVGFIFSSVLPSLIPIRSLSFPYETTRKTLPCEALNRLRC